MSAVTHMPIGVRLVAPARPDPLLLRAQRLWPDSERNQREWLRAVRVVRSTSRGWLLDRPVQR
jgi:hypothetical protein